MPAERADGVDHANPDIPRPIKVANRILRPFASALFPLDADGLINTARKKTGLHDLGDEHFREPLQRLVQNGAGLTVCAQSLHRARGRGRQ